MEEFDKCIREQSETTTGAILFAVCRGKVSEGIDFSDIHGRAVIITGLPFPPRQDPKVMAKINFLDMEKRKGGQGLGGNEWYTQQCTRAVNQAVGRVIRHRNDYGVVLFMDKRFSYPSNKDQLPKWVQGSVKVHDRFGAIMKDVSGFFKRHTYTSPALNDNQEKQFNPKSKLSKYYIFEMNRVDKRDPPSKVLDESIEVTPPPKRTCRPEKRESLVTCLRNSEDSDFEMPASLASSSGNAFKSDYKTPDQSLRVPKKRIHIVRHKDPNNNTEGLKNTEAGETSKSYPRGKVEKTKAYITKLKNEGDDKFRSFTNLLKEYRDSNDVQGLVNGMIKLYGDNRDLVVELKVFLKPGHMELFDKCLKNV